MKKRTNNPLVRAKKVVEPEESLEVSVTSYEDDADQSTYKRRTNNDTYLSSVLKNRFNNSTTIDTMPRRRKQHIFSELESMENIDPNDLVFNLKRTIHALKNKDASNRLQISRLNKQLQLLAQQYSHLEDEVRVRDEKLQKSNQYILRLDRQLRLYKDEVSKNEKPRGGTFHARLRRLEEQNQEMRFVIQEQLAEIEQLKLDREKCALEQRHNLEDIMKNLRTYPNSESERNTHPWEVTMNPNANQREFQTISCKPHHLSTVHQDASCANTSDLIKDRIYGMASLDHFSDYTHSKYGYDE